MSFVRLVILYRTGFLKGARRQWKSHQEAAEQTHCIELHGKSILSLSHITTIIQRSITRTDNVDALVFSNRTEKKHACTN